MACQQQDSDVKVSTSKAWEKPERLSEYEWKVLGDEGKKETER